MVAFQSNKCNDIFWKVYLFDGHEKKLFFCGKKSLSLFFWCFTSRRRRKMTQKITRFIFKILQLQYFFFAPNFFPIKFSSSLLVYLFRRKVVFIQKKKTERNDGNDAFLIWDFSRFSYFYSMQMILSGIVRQYFMLDWRKRFFLKGKKFLN